MEPTEENKPLGSNALTAFHSPHQPPLCTLDICSSSWNRLMGG
ncbi:rCG30003 [Rattus norvegicus]|uniref:RCG30003 n=1 Tax=Rattus norvegicus TaxID=10116 RepID=A6IKX7_RAT|nr:rCG30003 [Rattus norvegicus]